MIKVKAFCVQDHNRIEMLFTKETMRFSCPFCLWQITCEKAYRDIPKKYQQLFNSDLGMLAISMLDIGGINLIYDNPFEPKIEETREERM